MGSRSSVTWLCDQMGFDHQQPLRQQGVPRRSGRIKNRTISVEELRRSSFPLGGFDDDDPQADKPGTPIKVPKQKSPPKKKETPAPTSLEPKSGTKAHVDGTLEPDSLKHDLDLIDLLHTRHGHPGIARLRNLIKALQDDDPEKPSPKSLGHWKYYRMCQTCSHADMERPNQKAAHPETGARSKPEVRPGSHLTIDGSGAFSCPARSGETQAFILTDVCSSYRSAIPTRDKSCNTLLNEIKKWIAHVGSMPDTVCLRSIHTDNEFMCEPLREFCLEKGIKLTSCAPHTHQQNPIAETSVKMIKRVV
jgi:hypothetical protein